MASYFLPASIQKRLLKYALSRVDFLDSDVLDLENLDISWGKKSILEFRDVPLQLKKLVKLLQLPPTFDLTRARIKHLRITVPVDIYSSPIVVEVDGVEAQLVTISEHDLAHTKRRTHDRGKAGRSRHSHSTDAVIPTAEDLAASFLQTETEAEKARLQAEINSKSQLLSQSSESDDEDEDTDFGTGAGLGLPVFMANFLQGIMDRFQVKISNVLLNLDVNLPSEGPEPLPLIAQDMVSLQISVDDVDIEGITSAGGLTPNVKPEGPPRKEGKRLISFTNIRGMLISDANVFASLARSSAVMSSPSVTHSSVSGTSQKPWGSRSQMTAGSIASDDSVGESSLAASVQTQHSPSTVPILPPLVNSISSIGRFDDAPEDEEHGLERSNNSLLSSRHESENSSILDDSAYLDEMTRHEASDVGDLSGSHVFTSSTRPALLDKSPLSTPRASKFATHVDGENHGYFSGYASASSRPADQMQQTALLPERPHNRYLVERVSQSQPTISPNTADPRPDSEISHAEHPLSTSFHSAAGSVSPEVEESSLSSTLTGEDALAQSMVFSHDEAASMYMSAMSAGDSLTSESPLGSPSTRIPGAWDESIYDLAEPATPSTDLHDIPRQASHDNLEYAVHNTDHQAIGGVPGTTPSSQSFVSSQTPRRQNPALFTSQQRQQSTSELSSASDVPNKLAKQFFVLDQAAFYLPSRVDVAPESDLCLSQSSMVASTFDGQDILAQSIAPSVPGSFSSRADRAADPQTSRPSPNDKKPSTTKGDANPMAVEIRVGQFDVHFDVSLGRLMARLVQKVIQLLKTEPFDVSSSKDADQSFEPAPPIKLYAEIVSFKFLERLVGVVVPTASHSIENWDKTTSADILLHATLQGLELVISSEKITKTTSIKVQQFVFGYANEPIICFDASLRTRVSPKDLVGMDMHVEILQGLASTSVSVRTLPLHVAIDLQRLDETFSWFGGLSGVLNMGSSMASTITIPTPSPAKPLAKPRGVRFNAPVKLEDRSLSSQNKFTARLGGIVLDLLGKNCSVGIETTAVKIVQRAGLIGIGIDHIKAAGPHLRGIDEPPAIIVDVLGTSIEFLNAPDEDTDLTRLLALITPSKSKYDDDDNIMIDTLLRQRRNGSVLRLTVSNLQAKISNLVRLSSLPELSDELARLATVTKYLPEDDRPGLLSFILVHDMGLKVDVNEVVGSFKLSAGDVEIAQISIPPLIAVSVKTLILTHNDAEEVIGAATPVELREPNSREPAIMARMIGNEMEPKIKVKVWNLRVEYFVTMVIALLNMPENTTAEELAVSMAASAATLTGRASEAAQKLKPQNGKTSNPNPLKLDLVIRDSVLGLNPLGSPAKILVVLMSANVSATLPKDQKIDANLDFSKGSILVINDVANLSSPRRDTSLRRPSYDGGSPQINDLCSMGYVPVSFISSAGATVHVFPDISGTESDKCIDVQLRSDLLIIESCADSTQTLITALNGLTPPSVPNTKLRYRTNVMPIQDLLASVAGDAFGTAQGTGNFDEDFPDALSTADDLTIERNFEVESQYMEAKHMGKRAVPSHHKEEHLVGSIFFDQEFYDEMADAELLDTSSPEGGGELEFSEDHFGTSSTPRGTTDRWSSARNGYVKTETGHRRSPLTISIRDVNLMWNLFDGYDWQNTRDAITRAVQDVENKALERKSRSDPRSADNDFDEENTVIGDFLFNSIYIGIPSNGNPRDLAMAINQELNDTATETESLAPTTVSTTTSRPGGGGLRAKGKTLRLKRSKRNKISFELQGVNVDFVAYPPGSGETQISIDVRIRDLDVFDRIPTSTWRKFATYMHDAGERESGANQVHIELLTVKPVPELAASEIVMKVTVLPLRLHVDQDALDFITRFFEFKDDSVTASPTTSEPPFLQRVEVNAIRVRLDFKPKRVDYKGLRSGRTTEFMNFIVLDKADMVMRHCILYGISGFDKLGISLNDIWMPDIKRNQLPGILAGLAPFRPIVDVVKGINSLVTVPINEYKQDGRIWKGLGKGVRAFTGETGLELLKAGAKITTGTGAMIQGFEAFITKSSSSRVTPHDEVDFEDEEDETDSISPYARQPLNVSQGMKSAVAQIRRDLRTANGAIIAMPAAFMEKGTVTGAARAVSELGPTIILRPLIGLSKGAGQALLGAVNSLDPLNRQQVGDKYKSA